MSKANYGFRTGRLPLRPNGIPWAPIILAILAVFAWLWALAPREEEASNLSSSSITQSPSPVKGENHTPAPSVERSLETEAVTLYAVQISAHGDEAAALQAQEAARAQGLACSIYLQEETYKLLDCLLPTQEAADARKAELAQTGRDAYVFTWEIPAMQVELSAQEAEIAVWEQGLTLVTQAAQSPVWAKDAFAEYTAQGLRTAMKDCAEELYGIDDMQAARLAQTLEECAAALADTQTLSSGTSECALAASRYVRQVLAG